MIIFITVHLAQLFPRNLRDVGIDHEEQVMQSAYITIGDTCGYGRLLPKSSGSMLVFLSILCLLLNLMLQ